MTSSSLHACSISLFGCPCVIPEYPLDQSYDMAYAKIVPVRLKVVAEIGPGAVSRAVKRRTKVNTVTLRYSKVYQLTL